MEPNLKLDFYGHTIFGLNDITETFPFLIASVPGPLFLNFWASLHFKSSSYASSISCQETALQDMDCSSLECSLSEAGLSYLSLGLHVQGRNGHSLSHMAPSDPVCSPDPDGALNLA